MLSQLLTWLEFVQFKIGSDKQYQPLWQNRFHCFHFVKVENLRFRRCARGDAVLFRVFVLCTLYTINLILKSSVKAILELCRLSNAIRRQWSGLLWKSSSHHQQTTTTKTKVEHKNRTHCSRRLHCVLLLFYCVSRHVRFGVLFLGWNVRKEIAFSCDANRSAKSFCISLPDYPPLARKCPLPRSWGPSSICTIFHVKMYALRIVDSFNRVWVCSRYKNPVENVRNISSRDDWIVIIIWCIKSVSGETSISISNFNSIPIWCWEMLNVACKSLPAQWLDRKTLYAHSN